jgi:hypothetical protein
VPAQTIPAMGTKVVGQTARFAVAALTHEDFRYRRSESTEFGPRLLHAIGFIFVDPEWCTKDITVMRRP